MMWFDLRAVQLLVILLVGRTLGGIASSETFAFSSPAASLRTPNSAPSSVSAGSAAMQLTRRLSVTPHHNYNAPTSVSPEQPLIDFSSPSSPTPNLSSTARSSFSQSSTLPEVSQGNFARAIETIYLYLDDNNPADWKEFFRQLPAVKAGIQPSLSMLLDMNTLLEVLEHKKTTLKLNLDNEVLEAREFTAQTLRTINIVRERERAQNLELKNVSNRLQTNGEIMLMVEYLESALFLFHQLAEKNCISAYEFMKNMGKILSSQHIHNDNRMIFNKVNEMRKLFEINWSDSKRETLDTCNTFDQDTVEGAKTDAGLTPTDWTCVDYGHMLHLVTYQLFDMALVERSATLSSSFNVNLQMAFYSMGVVCNQFKKRQADLKKRQQSDNHMDVPIAITPASERVLLLLGIIATLPYTINKQLVKRWTMHLGRSPEVIEGLNAIMDTIDHPAKRVNYQANKSLKFALRAVRLKRKCDTIDMPSPAITRPFQDDRSLLQHYSRQVKQLETDVRNEIMRNNKFGLCIFAQLSFYQLSLTSAGAQFPYAYKMAQDQFEYVLQRLNPNPGEKQLSIDKIALDAITAYQTLLKERRKFDIPSLYRVYVAIAYAQTASPDKPPFSPGTVRKIHEIKKDFDIYGSSHPIEIQQLHESVDIQAFLLETSRTL